MKNTNVIASSENIEGNIGNCGITSSDIGTSSFTSKTVAINSCNGEIVSTSEYTSYGNILIFALGVSFIILLFGIAYRVISDY